jgi:hypothetical protein
MKKILTLAVLLCFAGITTQAQNNIFQAGIDSAVTNGAVVGGYWRAVKGNYSIVSYDYLYNFTTQSNSLGAGLLIGGDQMWGSGIKVQNDVKGGFAINYKGNLSIIGFTNTIFKIVVGNAIASPRQKNVGIGDITFANIDVEFKLYKQLNFHIDPAVQTRVGQGVLDKNYLGIQGALSIGF